MKKLFTFVLLSMIAFNAIHAKLTWNLSDDGTLIISGIGNMDEYPWDVYECGKVKRVIIEEGVTDIGEAAFMGCNNLTSVTIPNSVVKIGRFAFYWCYNLTSISIPKTMTSIDNSAFCETGLVSITVEEGNAIYDSRDNCNAIIETKSNALVIGSKSTVIPKSVKK